MRKFNFHYDAGHGWLEVHLNDLYDVGLSPSDISRYSYKNGQWFYLEEDLDAGTFLKHYEATVGHLNFRSINDGNDSPIRGYDRLPLITNLDEITF